MKDLVQIFLFTFVIVLTGCNASMDRYSGSGGLLHDHYDFRDYNDVVRRANIYCSSIGMGLLVYLKFQMDAYFVAVSMIHIISHVNPTYITNLVHILLHQMFHIVKT